MSDDSLLRDIPEEVRRQHPEAVRCALEAGERPRPDGTWVASDGRILDPQLGDNRLIPLNVTVLFGLPLLTVLAVPLAALTVGLSWVDLLPFLALWILTGISITAGYHRLFSHRTYKAAWPVRAFFALFGAMAMQNSILVWSRDHRYHHGMVDTIGDPYNARRGFWYSHFAWVLRRGAHSGDLSNVDDLLRDPIVAFQHKHYSWLVWIANFAAVLGIGFAIGRPIQTFVISGLFRLLFVQHGTFLINSWAHMFGRRPWSTANTARDSWVLSLFTFGEGYHNYHHAFATDYRNGVRWYHFDPSKWLIWTLSKVGLAWNLKRVPLEVTLHQRFQEHRAWFGERLRAAGEGQLDEWAAALTWRRSELRAAMEQGAEAWKGAVAGSREALGLQILAAETAVEEGLRELRRRRRELARQVSSATRGADFHELRARVRDGQREVQDRWEEFQRLVAAYEARLVPVPVRRE